MKFKFVLLITLILSMLIITGCSDGHDIMNNKLASNIKIIEIKKVGRGRSGTMDVIVASDNKQYVLPYEDDIDDLSNYYSLCKSNKKDCIVDFVIENNPDKINGVEYFIARNVVIEMK